MRGPTKDKDRGGAKTQRTLNSFFRKEKGEAGDTSTPKSTKNHFTTQPSHTPPRHQGRNPTMETPTWKAQRNPTKFTIPNFRRVSTNVSGLGSTTGNKQRREKTIFYLQKLLENHDIIYIQEAHITSEGELNDLAQEFPGCKLFGSHTDEAPAQKGVIIILKNTVTSLYEITQTYSSKTEVGRGRIISISLTPVGDLKTNLLTFRDTCVYFKSGGGALVNEERKKMVKELETIPLDTDIEFFGGDMNMHTNDLIEDFLGKRRMEEIEQPTNTFYRMVGSKITKTRIDRWFCNISPAQATILEPICRALTTAWGTIGRYSGGKMEGLHSFPSTKHKNATHITDHLPIGLYLQQPGEGGNANKKQTIPDWVLDSPLFREHFLSHWIAPKDEDMFTYKLLTKFCDQIEISAKYTAKTLGPTRSKEKTDRWKTALDTFKCLHKSASSFTDIVKTAQGDKEILAIIGDFIYSGERGLSCVALKEYLDKHIHDCYITDTETANNDTTTSYQKFDTKQKHSVIERLAKAFPKIKSKVTSLKDDQTEETEDPTEMARITKRYWSKHYGGKRLNVRIGRFLKRHYKDKRIKIDPKEISLELVENIILESGSTQAQTTFLLKPIGFWWRRRLPSCWGSQSC